jgi:hypothetical protein
MARVKLRYDDQVAVDDMDEIGVRFIVKDLPDVCLRCGRPATEVVEMDFYNYPEGRMATVHAPLCNGHPLMGMTTIIFVLCFLLSVPLVLLVILLILVSTSSWWTSLFFPMIALLWAIGIGVKVAGFWFDIDTDKIESNGVELKGVSEGFVTAYRKYFKERKRNEDEAVFGVPRSGLGEEGPGARRKRGSQGARRTRKHQRNLIDLLKRPVFYAAMGLVLLVGMSCFGITALFRYLDKKPGSQANQNASNSGGNTAGKTWPAAEKIVPARPVFAAAPKSPQELAGLIAYWAMDEGQGLTAANAAGSRTPATVAGAEWVQGVRNGALWFTGQDAFLDLGSAPELNFAAGQPFTVAGWFATRAKEGTIISFRHTDQPGPDIDVQISRSRLAAYLRSDGSEFGVVTVMGAVVDDGEWHHFALTRHADGLVELFLDGQPQEKAQNQRSSGSITTNLRAIGSERYWVQTNWTRENPHLGGAVDEVCVFGRVLDAAELAGLVGQR